MTIRNHVGATVALGLTFILPAVAAAEVTVTERYSFVNMNVIAESGTEIDQFGVEQIEEALSGDFERDYVYNAVAIAASGSASATGDVHRLDELIFQGGDLVQIKCDMDSYAETAWLTGIAAATVGISHTYRVRFVVTEEIEMVLEGTFNPVPGNELGDYGEVRMRKVPSLFDMFNINSIAGDSGPFSFAVTLEPGEYFVEADLSMSSTRTQFSDPPVEIESPDQNWTLTFGDGPAACPGDVDASGEVAFADLLGVLSAWGPCAGCPEDVDGDGTVGFADVLIVLSSWGPCP